MTSSGCARTIVMCFVAACGGTDRSSFSPSRDPAGPAAPSQGILFIIGDALRAANPIEATLDILPTRRWLDYKFRLGRVTADSVYLTGKGASYGDLPMARAYAW